MRRDCQYLPEGEQVVSFAVCVRTSVGCPLTEKQSVKKAELVYFGYWC